MSAVVQVEPGLLPGGVGQQLHGVGVVLHDRGDGRGQVLVDLLLRALEAVHDVGRPVGPFDALQEHQVPELVEGHGALGEDVKASCAACCHRAHG